MARWICPACEREFDLAHQAHTCLPGCTVDDTFAKRPQYRPIYDAIMAHLATEGTIHEDAVGVGVFLKRQRKLAEIRPLATHLKLYLFMPRRIVSARVARIVPSSRDRFVHEIKFTDPEQVDDEIREWLSEAYLDS